MSKNFQPTQNFEKLATYEINSTQSKIYNEQINKVKEQGNFLLVFTKQSPNPKFVNLNEVHQINCPECKLVECNHVGECFLADFFIMAKGVNEENYEEWFKTFANAKSFGLCLASLFNCINNIANNERLVLDVVREIPNDINVLNKTKAKFKNWIEGSGIVVAFARNHVMEYFDKKDIQKINCGDCQLVKDGFSSLGVCFLADFYTMAMNINENTWKQLIQAYTQPESFKMCLRGVLDCLDERSQELEFTGVWD